MMTSVMGVAMAFVFTIMGVAMLIVYVLYALGYMKCMQKAGEAGWKAWVPFYNDYIMYKIVGLNGGLVAVKILMSIFAVIYLVAYTSFMGTLYRDIDKSINNTNSSSYVSSSYGYKNTANTNKYSNSSKKSANSVISAVGEGNTTSTKLDVDESEYAIKTIIFLVIAGIYSLLAIAVFVINIFFAIKISKAYGLGGGYIAGMILLPDIFILVIGFGKSQYQGNYKPATN